MQSGSYSNPVYPHIELPFIHLVHVTLQEEKMGLFVYTILTSRISRLSLTVIWKYRIDRKDAPLFRTLALEIQMKMYRHLPHFCALFFLQCLWTKTTVRGSHDDIQT